MRKIFLIFTLFYLLPLYCSAKLEIYDQLASFQTTINTQRTNAAALIINSNLSDSVKNKPYCIFYMSGCRGILGWVIVVSDYQDYHIYYTDSFESAQENLFKTDYLPKDNEEMELLFSQKSLKGTHMKLKYNSEWYLTYYYWGLYDDNGNLTFDWNQSLCFHDVQTQKRIIRVCIKYIMPFIVLVPATSGSKNGASRTQSNLFELLRCSRFRS